MSPETPWRSNRASSRRLRRAHFLSPQACRRWILRPRQAHLVSWVYISWVYIEQQLLVKIVNLCTPLVLELSAAQEYSSRTLLQLRSFGRISFRVALWPSGSPLRWKVISQSVSELSHRPIPLDKKILWWPVHLYCQFVKKIDLKIWPNLVGFPRTWKWPT